MKAEWTNRDNLSIETTGRNSIAILVIDMPKSCVDCKYCGFEQFTHIPACVICESNFGKDEDIENNRSVICPLRPLPIKNKYKHDSMATIDYENDITLADYQNFGWNACLDEITGETE